MLNPQFVPPAYQGTCFAHLPATIKAVLTGQGRPAIPATCFDGLPQRTSKVVFLFVDSFGWHFFEAYKNRIPALQQLTEDGRATKMTAMFPSTTSAHVTTIHTGLPVAESGIYEWFYYEPQLDAMIAPLLFSFAGQKERNGLAAIKANPARLYPNRTLYQDLAAHGVTSHIFQLGDYTPSPYSDVVFSGGTVHPYKTLPEALVNLRQTLQAESNPAYFFFYFDKIDTLCHDYGPDSPQVAAEIDSFFMSLERHLLAPLQGQLSDTLLILTADHGHIGVDLSQIILLNEERRFPGLAALLQTNRQGRYLTPAGSPRDFFLHIRSEAVAEAQAILQAGLTGQAEVYRTADLLDWGIFGPTPPSATFLSRVGNLVVLPLSNNTVWWHTGEKPFRKTNKGLHGGLSPTEMETPLILYAF
ncbi:MAG: alkaline phosphatase family protein [Anaerolineae bacterium]